MKTALTVMTTAILTAIAFLFAWQNGLLGNNKTGICPTISCPTNNSLSDKRQDADTTKCDLWSTGASCTTPWGENIPHGKSVLSFQQAIATGDYQCEAYTSTCNDGSRWKDRKPYPFVSCSLWNKTLDDDLLVSKNCKVGDIIIPHDTTYTFYKEIKEGNTYTYQKMKRYCFDGKLEGDASYDKINMLSTCQPTNGETKEESKKTQEKKSPTTTIKPTAKAVTKTTYDSQPKYNRCTSPEWKIREHGKWGNYYLQDKVPYGNICQKIQVICGYGSLRIWSVDWSITNGPFYTTCEVLPPKSCTSSCGETAHGKQLTTYSKSILPNGWGKVCDDIKIVSTCNDGKRNTTPWDTCSCSIAPPAWCTAPNGQEVNHNESLTLYEYPEIQAVAWDGADTCVRQRRQCINGKRFNYEWAPADFTFKYPTCTVIAPPEWWGPGGEGVPQG